jgi:hypothetical protein
MKNTARLPAVAGSFCLVVGASLATGSAHAQSVPATRR